MRKRESDNQSISWGGWETGQLNGWEMASHRTKLVSLIHDLHVGVSYHLSFLPSIITSWAHPTPRLSILIQCHRCGYFFLLLPWYELTALLFHA